MFKLVMSFRNRFDFKNKGDMWLWFLDPDYPRKIVSPAPFMKMGINGVRLWYICEIMTRSEYYKLIYKGNPNVVFHDIDIDDMSDVVHVRALLAAFGEQKENCDDIIIPERKNVTKTKYIQPDPASERELESIGKLIKNMRFEPAQLAHSYYNSGRRLA